MPDVLAGVSDRSEAETAGVLCPGPLRLNAAPGLYFFDLDC